MKAQLGDKLGSLLTLAESRQWKRTNWRTLFTLNFETATYFFEEQDTLILIVIQSATALSLGQRSLFAKSGATLRPRVVED